ncbi:hypothetical protein TWF694_011469 [Orbilia ellipsospora]|uniref:B30.2/SPRY domain-containing protein n=1 Tax=Orbilia ellipsospora TaxID=2528407 RepID=A0AAV9X895_9PEZI
MGTTREVAAPLTADITLEASKCWQEARSTFEAQIRLQEKIPPGEESHRIKAFFKNTYTLDQTISSCEQIQNRITAKYGDKKTQNIVGTLLGTLNGFKSVLDSVLAFAPESVSAVWCGLGMIIKVVSDDFVTCQLIAGAYERIITIMLAALLFEKRHQRLGQDGKQTTMESFEVEIRKQITTLAFSILDFTWYTQHHIDPDWYKESDDAIAKDSGKLSKSTAQKLLARGKEKIKSASEEISSIAHKVGGSVKEAFMGTIKSKYDGILENYKELTARSSVAFQSEVVESFQEIASNLGQHFQGLEESLKSQLNGLLTESFDEIRIKIEQNHVEILNIVITANTEAKEERRNISEKLDILLEDHDKTPTPEQIFEKYKGYFRPSLAQKAFIATLFEKRRSEGAENKKSWLIDNELYKKWKHSPTDFSKILCLNGKKGHGKTMTLLSVIEDMEAFVRASQKENTTPNTILLRFFFKLGESELQSCLRAFESLLRQFLEGFSNFESQTNPETQMTTFEALNKILEDNGIQEIEKEIESQANEGLFAVPKQHTKSCKKISDILLKIAGKLGVQIYIVLDAMDECEDRKKMEIFNHLKGLVSSDDAKITILFSVREEIRIEEELKESEIPVVSPISGGKLSPVSSNVSVEFVQMDLESTARDMQDFLKVKLEGLVGRRLRIPSKSVIKSKVADLALKMAGKVNGDFSYANMVVANLQQPSKDSLDERIESLPSNLEGIYRKSLELLTAEQRSLVLFALRWIGWSESDISALEIAEHYKEYYSKPRTTDVENNFKRGNLEFPSPSDDPEIREIISHLRFSGRNFFTFNADEDPVTAHLSVREWIRNSKSPSLLLEGAQAQLVNSMSGKLVFEVQISPSSIPREYHELSELFSEEESHLAIALDILHALLDREFQLRYAPLVAPFYQRNVWIRILQDAGQDYKVDFEENDFLEAIKTQAKSKSRYEIQNWYPHILALQRYWHPSKSLNPKWALLRNLLACFTEPRNFLRYFAVLQKAYLPGRGKIVYSSDIQTAFLVSLDIGLDLMTEVCCRPTTEIPLPLRFAELQPHSIFANKDKSKFKEGQIVLLSFLRSKPIYPLHVAIDLFLRNPDEEALKSFLPYIDFFAHNSSDESIRRGFAVLVRRSLPNYRKAGMSDEMAYQIIDILRLVGTEKARHDRLLNLLLLHLAKDIRFFTGSYIFGHYLKYFLECGADPNTLGGNLIGSPLISLTYSLESCRSKDAVEPRYEMIAELVKAGADPSLLSSLFDKDTCPLFIASRSRMAKVVRLFLESKKTSVLVKDQYGASMMHHLFSETNRYDKEISKEESLETFNLIVKHAPELVNAQDNKSRAPLSWAVKGGFVDEVAWLLEQSANVNDEDELGQTALHDISTYFNIKWSDKDNWIKNIQQLLDHGADMRICSKSGMTAFAKAIRTLPASMVWEFIKHLPRQSEDVDQDFLCSRDINGQNILHHAAHRKFTGPKDVELLQELLRLLSDDNRTSLLSQEDQDGFSPLQRSAMEAFPFVPIFIKFGADTQRALPGRETMLHLMVKDLQRFIGTHLDSETLQFKPGTTRENESQSLTTLHEKLLIYLPWPSQIDPEDAVLVNLRNISIVQSWWLVLKKLVDLGIDLHARDEFGWDTFHMFKAFGKPSWFEHEEDNAGTPKREMPKPSAMSLDTSDIVAQMDIAEWDPIRMSKDGLEVTCSRGMNWFFTANYPIPIDVPRFYFEISHRSFGIGEKPFISIGFLPLPIKDKLYCTEVGSEKSGGMGWDIFGYFNNRVDAADPVYISGWDEGDGVLGLGFDHEFKKLFFTFDGKLVGSVVTVKSNARWVPAVTTSKGNRIKVNFGSDEFSFKEWEKPMAEIEEMLKVKGSEDSAK